MSHYDDLMTREGLLHNMTGAELSRLQGDILYLFQHSPRHRVLTLDEFARTVLPAIHFDQFRIYRTDARPVGWVNWAWMSDAEAQGYMAGDFEFTIDTWVGGEHLWFIDYVAPFGHALRMADDLKQNVFYDQVAYAPDLDEHTGSKRIRKFYGARKSPDALRPDDAAFIQTLV